ncbi:hypothetical protein Pelo_578 [Pelomyxa schiedti]|nr:hypothetical protein Pelo_578 [Pelomyxa schiedti]
MQGPCNNNKETTCSSCESSAATVTCQNCGVLCDACSKQLHSMKVLSWHTPSPISGPHQHATHNGPGTTAGATAAAPSTKHVAEKETLCPVHGKELDMFCVKDDVPVCAQCLLLGPHRDPTTCTPHACESTNDAVARMRRQLGDGKAFLSTLGDTLCARKSRLAAEQRRVDERVESAKAEVRNIFDALRAALGDRENELIAEIETWHCEKAANIKRLIDQVDASSTEISQSQSALNKVELLPSFPFLQSCKRSLDINTTCFRANQVPAEEPPEEIDFCAIGAQSITQQITSFGVIATGVSIAHSSFSASPQQSYLGVADTIVIKVTPSLCRKNGQTANETAASKVPLQLIACFANDPNGLLRTVPVKVNGLSVEVGPCTQPGTHKLSLQLHPFVTPVIVTLNVTPVVVAIGKSNATYPGYRMMTLRDFTQEPMKTRVFDVASAHGGAFLSLASFTPNNICLIQEGFVEFGGASKYLQATSTYATGDTAPVGQWNVCYLYQDTGRTFSQLRAEPVTSNGRSAEPYKSDTIPALFVSDIPSTRNS